MLIQIAVTKLQNNTSASSATQPDKVSIRTLQKGQTLAVPTFSGERLDVWIDGQALTGQQKVGGHKLKLKRKGNDLHLVQQPDEAQGDVTDLAAPTLANRSSNATQLAESPSVVVMQDFYTNNQVTLGGENWQFDGNEALTYVSQQQGVQVDSAAWASLLQANASGAAVAEASWLSGTGVMAGAVLVGLGAAVMTTLPGAASAPAVVEDLVIYGSLSAGRVIAGVRVAIFDKDGKKLGDTMSDDKGEYRLVVKGKGDYRGLIVAKMVDANGDLSDYVDETTGQATSLTTALRAQQVVQSSNVKANVSPFTEAAVRAATGGSKPTRSLDNSDVMPTVAKALQTNKILNDVLTAKYANVQGEAVDILTTTPRYVDGKAPDANKYQETHGTPNTAADSMGAALSAASGLDNKPADTTSPAPQGMSAAIDQIAPLASGATSPSTSQVDATLNPGAKVFEEGANKDIATLLATPVVTPPTQVKAADVAAGASVPINVVLPPKEVKAGDIVTSTSTAAAPTPVLSGSYTVKAGHNTNDLAITSYTLTGAVPQDLAGNAMVSTAIPEGKNLSDSHAIAVDTTAPTLTISSSKSALKVGETATITFAFSEAPTGFAADDVTVTGGNLSGLVVSPADPKVYTATFTPTADTNNGSASITVAANSYTDTAGNNGSAGNTPSLSFDTLAPTQVVALNSAQDDVAVDTWTQAVIGRATRIAGSANANKVTVSAAVSNDVTIEGWIKLDVTNAGAIQQLFHSAGMELYLYDGKLISWVTTGPEMVVAGYTPDTAWHHYALVSDADGAWKIYIDGELKQSRSGGVLSGMSTVTVGNYGGLNGYKSGLNGVVADVQMWDTARTPEQIAADLKTAAPAADANLKGFWQLGDSTANLVSGGTAATLGGSATATDGRTLLSNDATQMSYGSTAQTGAPHGPVAVATAST